MKNDIKRLIGIIKPHSIDDIVSYTSIRCARILDSQKEKGLLSCIHRFNAFNITRPIIAVNTISSSFRIYRYAVSLRACLARRNMSGCAFRFTSYSATNMPPAERAQSVQRRSRREPQIRNSSFVTHKYCSGIMLKAVLSA